MPLATKASSLSVLTPFILGACVQVGSALGLYAVVSLALKKGYDLKIQEEYEAFLEAKDRFTRDADASQAVVASAVLIASALLVPGVDKLDLGLLVLAAVIICFSLFLWVIGRDPSTYTSWATLGLTPLNWTIIALNFILAGLSWWFSRG